MAVKTRTGRMLEMEPPYRLLADLLTRGRLVPFLGAGASLAEDPEDDSLPTGRQLAQSLAKELGRDPEELGANSLLEAATLYEMVVGRAALQEKLRSLFLKGYTSGSIHRLLADISTPLLVITTNYDTLIERAFFQAKKDFHLVVTPVGREEFTNKLLWWKPGVERPLACRPNEVILPVGEESVVFKLHGSVDPGDGEFDSFVISEDDYFDMAGRYFEGALMPAAVAAHLQRSHIAFLGYSLRDIHLRRVVRKMRIGLKHFAIVRHLSELEALMWNVLAVEVYQMSIKDFVSEMRNVLSASTHSSAI
jgi:hypothetical protein